MFEVDDDLVDRHVSAGWNLHDMALAQYIIEIHFFAVTRAVPYRFHARLIHDIYSDK